MAVQYTTAVQLMFELAKAKGAAITANAMANGVNRYNGQWGS